MTLRRAHKEEIKTISSLYRSALGQPGCVWDEAYPTEADARHDYSVGNLYVLQNDSKIIGAASVIPENELDDLDCWHINDGTHREIARIVIANEYRGKGYARLMLEKLFFVLSCQGCTSIHLLVAAGNIAAIKTYKSLGFEFILECDMFGHHYHACEKILTQNKKLD